MKLFPYFKFFNFSQHNVVHKPASWWPQGPPPSRKRSTNSYEEYPYWYPANIRDVITCHNVLLCKGASNNIDTVVQVHCKPRKEMYWFGWNSCKWNYLVLLVHSLVWIFCTALCCWMSARKWSAPERGSLSVYNQRFSICAPKAWKDDPN